MVALARKLLAPDPGDVRSRILVQAIARYEDARDLRDEADRRLDADPALDRWCTWMADVVAEAERLLLGSILALDELLPADMLMEALFEYHRPLAVVHDGRAYVAVPDPDVGPAGDPGDRQVMRLAILDLEDVADLAGAPDTGDATGGGRS